MQKGLARRGPSASTAPGPEATSAPVPVSTCVGDCFEKAIGQAACSDVICFCDEPDLINVVEDCVREGCPSDEAQVAPFYGEACQGPLASSVQNGIEFGGTSTNVKLSSSNTFQTMTMGITSPVPLAQRSSDSPNTGLQSTGNPLSHTLSALPEAEPTHTASGSIAAIPSPSSPLPPAPSGGVPDVPSASLKSSISSLPHSNPLSDAASSPSPQPTSNTTTSAASRRGRSRVLTPVLAGVVSSAILSILAAAVLLRFWARRRRARRNERADSLCQDGHARAILSTSRDASHTSVSSPHNSFFTHVEDRVSDTHAHDPASLPGSVCAQDGSAVTPSSPTAPSTQAPSVSLDVKDGGHPERTPSLPSPPYPEPPFEDPGSSRPPLSGHGAPQNLGATAGLGVEPDAGGDDRLLHLTLPWSLGQRMLAMIARASSRDTNGQGNSMDGHDSEPPPAYEPRA